MSVSVLENIALTLLARLEGLVNNGGTYNTDVVEVIRPTRLGSNWTPQHLQIVLTQGASEVVDELSYPGNPPAICRRQTFNIRCHVMSDEQDTEAIETVINTFAADIVKVVCTPSEWYNFSGYAINSEWLAMEDIASDGSVDGCNVLIAVYYRTDENDPYTVRA